MIIKNTIKKSIIWWFFFTITVIVSWIVYANISEVSSRDTLTAQIFNESMVPTWAVMAFYSTTCPAWWNKADWSWDEKMVNWKF